MKGGLRSVGIFKKRIHGGRALKQSESWLRDEEEMV